MAPGREPAPRTSRDLRPAVLARRLPTGSFAFVMATGIVSSALALDGEAVVSAVLLAFACAGAVVLVVATAWRMATDPRSLVADPRSPDRAFGLFTVVAALNVLAVRFADARLPAVTAALAAAAVVVWVPLTYAVPAALTLEAREQPLAQQADGTWFLWVVATQSLAGAGATLGDRWHSIAPAMAPAAVSLWSLGVVLYLVLAGLEVWRLLARPPSDPQAFSSSYWISMGATAVTVLAGAQILKLGHPPILVSVGPVVSGITYLLWSFGSWWIPMLVVFGFWRHVLRRTPLTYEYQFWSIVFPLGMYAVGTSLYSDVEGIQFMHDLGRVWAWVGLAAWVLVTLAMLRAAAERLRARGPAADVPG